MAQRSKSDSLGGFPCIKMPILKIRPAAQTDKRVRPSIPIRPIQGCHMGIPAGELSLRSISIGVKGGNREVQVAKLLVGS